LDVFIDGFANFSLFLYIIYDHLKCVSRLGATLYIQCLTHKSLPRYKFPVSYFACYFASLGSGIFIRPSPNYYLFQSCKHVETPIELLWAS